MKIDGRLIIPETVEYAEATGNCCIIHFVDGRNALSSHNLGRVCTYLKLSRIHKQHAVNVQHVAEIDLLDRVVMKSGKVLNVSRRRIQQGVLRSIIKNKKNGLTQNPNH